MVSSAFSSNNRYCPALDKAIASEKCGRERLTQLDCPLSCPFNPFHPDEPTSFDSVFGRGLKSAGRWIEKALGADEWAARYREMERRFLPEDDIPLVSYEAQWAALAETDATGQTLLDRLDGPEGGGLRNDTRIVLRKLAESRALLLETLPTDGGLPYYECRDLIQPQTTYRYVDFGEQEPLEDGAVLFGRFLEHDGCLYVVPGIFVGSAALGDQFKREFEGFLGARGVELDLAAQDQLPELWNLCADKQDAFDALQITPFPGASEDPLEPEEYYRATLQLKDEKQAAVLALRSHPLFEEEDPKEFGIDLFEPTVFRARVTPSSPFDEDLDDDEEPELFDGESLDEEDPVQVGTVYVEQEQIVITAYNGVELELLKALVASLAPCER